jgi:competence protein ComEA
MFKYLLALAAALFAAVAFAATDVNKATQAELEAIKGVGPAIAGKILDERKKGAFKDWPDFIDRVKGVGEGNAAKFSAEGLTVGGAAFKGVAAAAKKDEKPAAKAAAAAPAAAPAPTAAPAKAEAKPAEKATAGAKPADKPAAAAAPVVAKADAKPAAKDEKAAAGKDDKKSAKEDKKMAVKADAAASAAKK